VLIDSQPLGPIAEGLFASSTIRVGSPDLRDPAEVNHDLLGLIPRLPLHMQGC